MHFVAMLALRLPVATMYDVPLVILSVLVAIGASLVALLVVSREAPRVSDLALAAPLMGSAIAGMHYIGMAAVRVPAVHQYDSLLVVLSVAAQQRNVLQRGDAFLAKPFTPDALARKVREVLDGQPAASAPDGAYRARPGSSSASGRTS